MQNKISVRQICIILAAYGAVTKLLLFPAQAAVGAGNSLLFPILFDIFLQSVIIWAVAYLSSRTDKTFYTLLEGTFGKVTAKIIFFLFALYFLLSAVVPLAEQQLFVHDTFYDTIPSLFTFLPFFIFALYAGAKGFTNAGRCADFCLPVFIFTLLVILVMSASACDFSVFMPVLKQPFSKVAGTALSGFYRFSESAFLLMFMGHYKYRKGDSAKITLSYVAGGLVVLAFVAIFYAVYGVLAPNQTYAISSISIFFAGIELLGRVDLLALYALDIVMLFAIVINIQMFTYCLKKCFGYDNGPLWSVIANGALFIFCILNNNNFTALEDAAAKWFWIVTLVFAYAVPLLAWALKRGKNEKAFK